MTRIEKVKKVFEILENYKGDDPFISKIKYDLDKYHKTDFNEFELDYIIGNHDFEPIRVNKIATLSTWFAESMQSEWNVKFVPKRILVGYVFGMTDNFYHCYVKYKQNMENGVSVMIPKKAMITDLFARDYNLMDIDFDKYDAISTQKDPNRKLKEHQKTAVKFLLDRKKCILADGMGLGKTTSLAVAAIEGNYDRVVVICPASVKTTWKKELMWYIDGERITIVESILNKKKSELESFLGYKIGESGKKADELREEAKQKTKWKDNDFVIINYDILDDVYQIPKSRSKKNIEEAAKNSPLLQYALGGKKSLLIIDEAHKLSTNTSIRYKVVNDLIKKGNFDSVFMATGTPITNRPLNFYHILKLINHPVTVDWTFYVQNFCDAFQIPAKGEKERYTNIYLKRRRKHSFNELNYAERGDLKDFIRKHARLIWIANGASNLDELKERVQTIYLRRVKEDIPGMVQKNISVRYYDMTLEEQARYDVLWDEYEEAQREEGKDDASLNRDLIEGGLLRRFISEIMVPHTEKLVDELLEEDEKVIIACAYDNELYQLQEYYGDRCVIYNGKLNAKQKDKAQDEFMNNPKIKVFIGNIDAAGVGLTLTSSRYVVFNNMSFVPSDNEQMMDRVHRLSQSNDVEIIFQIFSGTIYEHIWNVVMSKQYVINNIIKKEGDK